MVSCLGYLRNRDRVIDNIMTVIQTYTEPRLKGTAIYYLLIVKTVA